MKASCPMPSTHTVCETLRLPNLVLRGIGANLACRSGVVTRCREHGRAVDCWRIRSNASCGVTLEHRLRRQLRQPALGAQPPPTPDRINDLAPGRSRFCSAREPLRRQPIDGLHTDAITLIAEVIESKVKPSKPWGEIAQTAFGEKPPAADRGLISQAILAIGHQDTDPCGLCPPPGIEILGASSDHLIVETGRDSMSIGSEIKFKLGYGALVRAMTSPFVVKVMTKRGGDIPVSVNIEA